MAWVTHALSEETLQKTLTLGKSLRVVLTRKCLVVLIHPSLSSESKAELNSIFDIVLPIDLDDLASLKSLPNNDSILKALVSKLSVFSKVIYLNPSSLVFKNSDHFFDNHQFISDLTDLSITAQMIYGPAFFAFIQPSEDLFEKIKDIIATPKGSFAPEAILDWPLLPTFGLKTRTPINVDTNLSIAYLSDVPSDPYRFGMTIISSNSGILEKHVYWQWVKTFNLDLTQLGSPHVLKGQHKLKEPIAIVGMSCRFPASNHYEDFWNLIIGGGDAMQKPAPPYRWTKEQKVTVVHENEALPFGFMKCHVDENDAKFFGISPKEFVFMDPQFRVLLELVWEAVEDAGIDPQDLSGVKGGVFVGTWRNDFEHLMRRSGLSKQNFRSYQGNSIGSGASRISQLLGLTGPCVALEAACCSSMISVNLACKSLQSGDCPVALACGANIVLNQFTSDLFPGAVSPTGRCKPFDASADGFGRADGCAVLVLKRLSTALADSDRIWGLIRGTAIAQEGLSKSFGTPTVQREAQVMRDALKEANINPVDVSFVECHGTGTVVGDPIEVSATSQVYNLLGRENPLLIGSVKGNVGHTESTSGITGMMKVILSMKNEMIPPQINFKMLNPQIKLDNMKIPLEALEWPKVEGKQRYAGISSFGITGTDGHAIIEEAIDPKNHQLSLKFPGLERPQHILKISAKSPEALEAFISSYKEYLEGDRATTVPFHDIVHASNTGKASLPFRCAIIANSREACLEKLENGKYLKSDGDEISGPICFLFPGQGSQYHGMAKLLYSTSPIFRNHYDYCDNFLQTKYNISLGKVFWSQEPNDQVNNTLNSQPGIFVIEYCLLKLWESWGIKPDYVLGHSLGEYCAAVAAGILNIADALKLVAERSLLIDKLEQGKMVIIKAGQEKVEDLLNDFYKMERIPKLEQLDFAAINSDEQTVVGGDLKVAKMFLDYLKEKKMKCTMLNSSHAFHSKQMDPILDKLGGVAESLTYKRGEVKYVSGMAGKVLSEDELNWSYWVSHTRDPVQFLKASKAVYEEGARIFIEIGPNPILTAMVLQNNDGAREALALASIRKGEDEWTALLGSLGKLFINGIEINWKGFDLFYERNKLNHALPSYPFQRSKIWPQTPKNLQTSIHPLLGHFMPNPVRKIFQAGINLKDLPYLKDHVIGNIVVFPGAGYMETLMMAGFSVLNSATNEFILPRRPIELKDCIFGTALGIPIDYEGDCLCQTVVENEGEECQIVMYHQDEDKSSLWVKHASATFHPQITDTTKSLHENGIPSIETLREIQAANTEENMFGFYEKLDQVGLKMGPTFRTLQKVWRDVFGNFVCEVNIPKDSYNYLIHPTILDAMVQVASIQNMESDIAKLRVPIRAKSFTWHSSPAGQKCFIISTDKNLISLINEEGDLLVTLSGVEMAETNVRTIQNIVETQQKAMPDFFEIEWKPTVGPNQSRAEHSRVKSSAELMAKYPDTQPPDYLGPCELYGLSKDYVSHYVLKGLKEMGWEPEDKKVIVLDELVKKLGILPVHSRIVRLYFDHFFVEDGTVRKIDEDKWEVIDLEKINEILALPQYTPRPDDFAAMVSIKCGSKLPEILRGSQDPLEILFPDDQEEPSAAFYYDILMSAFKDTIKLVLTEKLELIKKDCEERNTPLPIIRILEVGAGTGAASTFFFKVLNECGIPFEYSYTDISSAFFPGAQKRFPDYLESIKFRKLNVEEEALGQGFPPNYYDIIIAIHILHATRDIKESLLNLRQLMKKGGDFFITETLGIDRNADLMFGLIDGYWTFTDGELRPDHCCIDLEKWRKVMKETGWGEVATIKFNGLGMIIANNKEPINYGAVQEVLNEKKKRQHDEEKGTWLIFYDDDMDYVERLKEKFDLIGRKKAVLVKHGMEWKEEEIGREFSIRPDRKEDMDKLFDKLYKEEGRPNRVEGLIITWGLKGDGRDQTKMALPFFFILQNILQLPEKISPQVVVLTCGQQPIPGHQCCNPSSSTLLGMIKSSYCETPHLKLRGIDIQPDEMDSEGVDEVFTELFNFIDGHPPYFCSFKEKIKYIPRFVRDKFKIDSLKLPQGTSRFQIQLPETRTIDDVKFIDLDEYSLEPNEIEVRVRNSSLNFRDIYTIMLQGDRDFTNIGAIFDFSGIISKVGSGVTKWKVGDAVLGLNIYPTVMPSHVRAYEDLVIPLPDGISHAEACCFPLCFKTVYYSIDKIAKAKKGETILLHTASGGVGLTAINYFKHNGLDIIATAGTPRKRAYLRSLGIKNVFNSRNIFFKERVLEATNGRGVDIVLNSITGPGLIKASLECLAKNGRFLELSKVNIWKAVDVKKFRQDVKYFIVDIPSLSMEELQHLYVEMGDAIKKGFLKPIPYDRFDAVDVRQALSHLQHARHIGKVVITMPDRAILGDDFSIEVGIPLFHERGAYLITGGLSGVGFEVCRWMLDQGARVMILNGRNPPKPKVASQIDYYRKKYNAIISVILGDCGNMEDCRRLFDEIRMTLPPLKGIMHSAGTLADGVIQNLEWKDFQNTFRAKVEGSWNLHELTKEMTLEFFILYSSVAAKINLGGQTTHCSACTFEDAIVQYRNCLGLKATSINWGQWDQIGIAADVQTTIIKAFSPQQGINALDRIMRTNRNHIAVLSVEDTFGPRIQQWPYFNWLVEENVFKSNVQSNKGDKRGQMSQAQFMKAFKEGQGNERIGVVKNQIELILRHVLRFDERDRVDEDTDFSEMGLDSLMMLEVQNHLQSSLGEAIPVSKSILRDYPTIRELSKQVVGTIDGAVKECVVGKAAPTLEDIERLVREDCKLKEDIQLENPGSEVKPSQIKTVLITGTTGLLGSYILRDLLKNHGQVEKIYCLVRPLIGKTPKERLCLALEAKGINIIGMNLNKVEAIYGTFVDKKFGLEEEAFGKLCSEVDAVIHCAAKICYTEYYERVEGGRHDSRSVNVGGMDNILEFVGKSKTKHLFYASTILASDGRGDEMVESWPDPDKLEIYTTCAYATSKYVGDLMLGEAVKRGFPCKSFRYGEIRGSQTTGKSLSENSLIMKVLGFLLQDGMLPENPYALTVVSVDVAASLTARLLFRDDVENDVYNITHPKPDLLQNWFGEFAKEFGIEVKAVNLNEYRARILKSLERNEGIMDGAILAGFKNLYADDLLFWTFVEWCLRGAEKYLKNKDYFKSKKMAKLEPKLYLEMESTKETVIRDIYAAKKENLL